MARNRNTIAIIDDDAGIRASIRALLSAHGYHVELYSSAEEFIASAPISKAACSLVDIQLGGISGLELGRRLIGAGLIFPIIFMTGCDDEEIYRQAISVGCIAYLRKPFQAKLLIDAIAKATT